MVHGTAKLSQGEEAQFTTPDELPVVYDESQSLATRLNLVAPYKPKLDVVVVGKAYAPPRVETDRLVVRLRIGDFTKAVSVTGDRLWMRDAGRWGSSPPRPFGQMALSPERAIRSAENPAGLDPAAIPIEGRLAMANLEPVAGSFSAITGAVHPQANSRRNLLDAPGVYWVTALESGRSPGTLPDGFNFQFFNIAPQDQQLEKISPGDAVVLENMHPTYPVFTSRLPTLMPRVVGVDGTTGNTFEVPMRCDTLWLDGDRETAWIVYRGTASLSRPDQPLSLRVETERYRRPEPSPMSTATMLTTQQGAVRGPLPFTGTSHLPPGYAGAAAGYGQYAQAEQNKSALSAESTGDLPGSYPPPPPTAGVPGQVGPGGDVQTKRITEEIELEPAVKKAPTTTSGLPFAGDTGTLRALVSSETMSLEIPDVKTPGFAIPRAPTGQFYRPAETSLADPRVLVQRASPGPVPEIGPTLQPILPAPAANARLDGMRDETPDATADEDTPATDADDDIKTIAPPPPAPPVVAEPAVAISPQRPTRITVPPPAVPPPVVPPPRKTIPPGTLTTPIAVAPTVPITPVRVPPKPLGLVPPPRKAGPATVNEEATSMSDEPADLHARTNETSAFVDEPTPPASAPQQAEPPPAPAPPREPTPPPRDPTPTPPPPAPTMADAAWIRAKLSVKDAVKADIFGQHGFDEASWLSFEREQLQAIDAASQNGDPSMLERYDDAYLAALDEIRGKVDELGYARIQFARESGQLAVVLEELNVQRNDLMRLERTWRRRLQQNATMRDRVEDELERLRGGA